MIRDVVRLIYFVLFIGISAISQRRIWQIVYANSGKSMREIFEYGFRMPEINDSRKYHSWLVASSSDSQKSRRLLSLISFLTLLPFVGVILALNNLIVDFPEPFLDYFAIVLWVIVLITYISGVVYYKIKGIEYARIKDDIRVFREVRKAHAENFRNELKKAESVNKHKKRFIALLKIALLFLIIFLLFFFLGGKKYL